MENENEFDNDYGELEELYKKYIKSRKEFLLHKRKYLEKLDELKKKYRPDANYQQFQKKVRQDLRKKRKYFIEMKMIPKNMELDHRDPILYYFLKNKNDINEINSLDNLNYIPRNNNRIKGILRQDTWLEFDIV